MFTLFVLFGLPWLVVLYAPFVMRTWRSFGLLCLGYVALAGIVRIGVATFDAGDVPTYFVEMGNFWIDWIRWILPIPVVARALILMTQTMGLSGRALIAANIAGILALPAYGASGVMVERFGKRPPPESCTRFPIPLALTGQEGRAPWNPGISFHTGPDLASQTRYVFSPRHQRAICRSTAKGRTHLSVTAITLRAKQGISKRCDAADAYSWETAMCESWDSERPIRVPQTVTIFDPDGIQLGHFAIPATVTDAPDPTDDRYRVVPIDAPGLGQTAAQCRDVPGAGGHVYCRMRRDLGAQNLDIYWDLSATQATLMEALVRAETIAQSFCAESFSPELCRTP